MVRTAINPDVLEWAMLESARSVSDLESATQKPRDEVEKWLSGAVSPHLGELRRLGKLLGRSPFFFMLPEPPSSTPTAVEFRRALRKDINEDERAVELQALRWGRRTQSVARDLLNSADLLGNATTWPKTSSWMIRPVPHALLSKFEYGSLGTRRHKSMPPASLRPSSRSVRRLRNGASLSRFGLPGPRGSAASRFPTQWRP